MHLRYSMTVGAALALACAGLRGRPQLKVEIPRLTVAEYHRPYVAHVGREGRRPEASPPTCRSGTT